MAKPIEFVVRISSGEGAECEECSKFVDGSKRFARGVNHYLRRHAYKLLHIGSEAGTDYDGKPCHHTVAIVGTKKRPKKRKGSKMKKSHVVTGH
jgi:hypothetical protein